MRWIRESSIIGRMDINQYIELSNKTQRRLIAALGDIEKVLSEVPDNSAHWRVTRKLTEALRILVIDRANSMEFMNAISSLAPQEGDDAVQDAEN